jgi:hypothetical protein
MSKKRTPEDVLNSVVEGINTGDLEALMKLYESDACFATQPGNLQRIQNPYAKVYVVSST